MAIFKDKTGRGEVDYAKSPVQGSDGTILFLNDRTGMTPNVYGYSGTGLHTNHVVFQLRGESGGVQDVSDSRFSVTESTALTKRIENVTHNQKLKTFEFNDGRTATFSPKLDKKYQRQETLASLSITLNIVPSVSNTISITFGSYGASAPQVITMAVGAGTDSTSFSLNAATIYAANNATTTLTAASIAVLANSVNSYTATSLGAVITITATNPDVNLSFTYSETISVGNASDVVNTPGVTPTQYPPNLGRGQGHSNSPHESILPFEVGNTAAEFNTVVEDGDSQIILSFWVRPSSFGQGTDGGGSCIMEQVSGTARGFGVILTSTGELVFRFYDFGANSTSANAFQQIKTTKRLVLNQWYHITIFAVGMKSVSGASSNPLYNPGGLDQSYASGVGSVPYASPQVEIYINGSAQTDISELGNTSGNFAGNLNAVPSMPVVLGTGLAGYDSTPEFQSGAAANFNGRLAEVTYFYTHSLERALNQIAGAANVSYRSVIARSLMTGTRQPTSGITNVSERLLLRDLDQHSAHPTVKRSGDQRRLGNHTVKFDDSKAQTLGAATVQYPTKLVSGDNLLQTIYGNAGYFDGSLTLQHTASVESYDTRYRRNDQPSLDPFVESRVYIDSGSTFYQTGTLESVLPGFSGPLHNKAMFIIDLTPSAETELDNGHVSISAAESVDRTLERNMKLMAYYNFDRKIWEPLHHSPAPFSTSTPAGGNAIDSANLQNDSFIARCYETRLGFSPMFAGQVSLVHDTKTKAQIDSAVTGDGNPGLSDWTFFDDNAYKARAKPTDFFGFPVHAKYHATSSCAVSMSDYIAEPFLLEKIEYTYYFETKIPRTTNTEREGSFYNTGDLENSGEGIPEALYLIRDKTGINNDDGKPSEVHNGVPDANNSIMYFNAHSFFVLKQSLGVVTGSNNGTSFRIFGSSNLGTLSGEPRRAGPAGTRQASVAQSFSIPTSQALVSGSSALTYVEDTRELIGYAQHVHHGYNDKSLDNPSIGKLAHDHFASQDRLLREVNINVNNNAYDSNGNSFTGYEDYPEFTMRFTPSKVQKTEFGGTIKEYTGFSYQNNNHGEISLGHSGQRLPGEMTSGRDFAAGVTGQLSSGSYIAAGGPNVNSAEGVQKSVATINVSDSSVYDQAAPYVLLPEDKLIFGWQCPYHGIDGLQYASYGGTGLGMTLKSKNNRPQKITFYGSFIRNSQPKQPQLNQLLNNDIVHESIGAVSIHDQFDIESSSAFSGSYVDEAMSGSLEGPLYRGWNNKFHSDNGGSSVTAELTTNLARRVGGRNSVGSIGTTGSLRRTVSIASHDVTEYDSFLFDLESMFSVDERSTPTQQATLGNYQNDLGTRKADDLRIGNDPSLIGNIATNAGVIANVDIGASFFYHRYNTVGRVRSSQIGKGSTTFTISVTGSYSVPGLIDPDQPSTFVGTKQLLNQRPLEVQAERGFINSAETSQFMFGIGEGVQNAHVGIVGGGGGVGIDVEKIRGFRYGFSNVVDKKPRNVFRRDRYGQLRDMLEMAPNTAYINDRTNQITYPIEARFFDNDGSVIQPGNTSCSNLSTYCTSSAPYFDRDKKSDGSDLVIRNRGPLNNKIADITIEI